MQNMVEKLKRKQARMSRSLYRYVLRLKRAFYKFVTDYNGPLSDDITYNDIFVAKQIAPQTIYNELIKNNIKVLNKTEHNNSIIFVCSK